MALRLVLSNSRQAPSTDLGLGGHPAHLLPEVPWVVGQTQGLPSISMPLTSAAKQRQPLLSPLFHPHRRSRSRSTGPSPNAHVTETGAGKTEIQPKNTDCFVPELCLGQTSPDCKHSSSPIKVCNVQPHAVRTQSESPSTCDAPVPLLQVTVPRRKVIGGRAERCCLMAKSLGSPTYGITILNEMM